MFEDRWMIRWGRRSRKWPLKARSSVHDAMVYNSAMTKVDPMAKDLIFRVGRRKITARKRILGSEFLFTRRKLAHCWIFIRRSLTLLSPLLAQHAPLNASAQEEPDFPRFFSSFLFSIFAVCNILLSPVDSIIPKRVLVRGAARQVMKALCVAGGEILLKIGRRKFRIKQRRTSKAIDKV